MPSQTDRSTRPMPDAIIAASVLLATLPAAPLFMAAGLLRRGRIFERRDGVIAGYASGGPLSGVAAMIPVLTGLRRIIGPRPRAAHEQAVQEIARQTPGLVSEYRVALAMGVPPQSEDESDIAMMARLNLKTGLRLILQNALAALFAGNASQTPDKIRLLGIDIDNLDMETALGRVVTAARGGNCASMAFVNADCLNRTMANPSYARILGRQELVFADGSGLRLAAKLRGQRFRGNINGTDMFPLLCASAAREGLPVFLLGASPGIAALAAASMLERVPGLVIAGSADGFFRPEEQDALIDQINASGARILLVAMGAPNQELWIAQNQHRLRAGVAIGVGGLFDFYSGRISRAPLWMRQAGLEWIWRFMQEPRRMWRRYFVGNFVFIYRCWREQRSSGTPGPRVNYGWRHAAAAERDKRRWHRSTVQIQAMKRMLDMAGAATGVLLLSPILLAVAAAIRLESPGPVFFTQTRVGRGGRRFRVWKFRSMYIDAEARRAALLASSDRAGAHFKMKQDPRITRVGRLLRRTSVDELPQLFNVLNGTMSIVGPRPNLESEVARYRLEEFGRLSVKPGITCTWQVSGRAELPWDRQVALDLDYAYDPSVLADISLIVRTVPAVVSGRGAY